MIRFPGKSAEGRRRGLETVLLSPADRASQSRLKLVSKRAKVGWFLAHPLKNRKRVGLYARAQVHEQQYSVKKRVVCATMLPSAAGYHTLG